MASFKAHAWVLSVLLVPLLLFAWRASLAHLSRISMLWTAAFLILYTGLLQIIVYPFYTNPRRHLPQLEGDRFALGHFLLLIGRPPGLNLLQAIRQTPNDGLVLCHALFCMGGIVVLTSPEALAEVLSVKAYDFVKHGNLRKFLEPIIGKGLVTVEGKQHKTQRRILTPPFSGKQINNLVPVFWSKALEFVDTIGNELASKGEGTIEMNSIASRVTLDIIGLASVGKDFETLKHADNELAEGYSNILDPTKGSIGLHALLTMQVSSTLARLLLPKTHRYIESTSDRIRAACGQFLAEKRAEVEENPGGSVDILAALIRDQSLTDREILDHLLTFLAAGHETTASALAWATYELSRHPAMQDRLRTELRANAIVASGKQGLQSTDLDSLPSLHAFCMETLRFWSVVPGTSRVALRDTTVVGKPILKGQEILIPIPAINRSPDLWGDDAETFQPDRWLRQDGGPDDLHGGSPKSPYSFMTFLHGPRSCIGQGFARNELKCLIAAMVNRYEVGLAFPEKRIEPAGIVSLKPKDALDPKTGLVVRLRELL